MQSESFFKFKEYKKNWNFTKFGNLKNIKHEQQPFKYMRTKK